MDSKILPVACQLSSAELRQREATLLAEFKSAARSVDELPDGFRFHHPGNDQSLTSSLASSPQSASAVPSSISLSTPFPTTAP